MSQRGGQQYISNQFDKIRVLGKGSFGTATVHRRRADCTLVVLKEIDLSKFHSEQQRSSAIQEARIMSKLNHNNIIKYYNAYTTDSKLIIEMEYASIGTLQAYLSFQSQLLDEQEILVIFRQIGSGLSYLHSKGIIHLDLKMANIFITVEGLVKIGDFGIAQFMQSSQSALSDQSAPKNKKGCKKRPANNDNNSHQLGTLAYSSPERCLGNQTDFKSDIWSLGCILYELITSKPLFSASSLPELVLSITRIQYQPIKRIVSPALTDIFTQTISREPIDRPTAEDLVCLTDQLLSRLQFHKQRSLMMQTKQHRPNHHRFDLSTDAAYLGLANREPDSSPSINYPHSLVYQVRLDTRHIQVDRVNLPQTKRIKEICKGKSHYLVLTYDSVVYGWGSRNRGQLGACNLTSSSSCTNPNDFNAGVSSGRALNRTSRSARNSMNARDWQLAQGQQLHSTPPSLASSAHTLISTPSNHNQQQQQQHPLNTHQVRAANQILSKQLVMSMLEKSQPVSRPFVLNELNNRKIIQVAAGNDFSVFLSRTGIVLTCGEGSTGCLGRGDFQSCFVPCMVDSLLNCDVVSVSCGPKHVVAVCGNGRVFAWGKWSGGRLGVSIGPGNSTIISNGATMGTTSYKASKRHSALAANQTVIGKYVVRPQPVEFPDDVFIKSAYCCDRGTIFIDSNDQCWACGSNRFNKLGLDIKRRFKRTIIVEQCWLPTEIQALSKYKIISCSIGKNHSSFITTEGKSLILGHDIDHSHRLRSNIVDNRLSHRRISSQLQTNRHKRKSWLQEQHQQTLQANARTGQSVLSQSTGDMNKNLPHYKELTRSMLHHDQLSSFKKEEEATTTSPENVKVPKYKVKRLYRQQIDSYLRQSRGMRKMPFECVLGVNCTSKFTLAMTNDNRIYFWGTRSYEKGEPCLSSMYLDCCTRTKHNVDFIEPQLISSSSDECFIKIGSTNSPLMSIIQTLGSDQPIIHAQDPRLTADSLADLWILDYRPSDSSSSSSSSSCCSSSVSNSSLSSVCSCRSTCSCDCAQLAPNVCQQNLLDSDNEDDDCTKHDAILEPQPILSLYVPSMFNHNTSALRLVKLFCFDEDRFYLVLDTTVKLQASSFSRPISRSPRIAHQTNRGQHQQQPSSPKLKLNILRESLTLDVDRQKELAANEIKSASTRNLVSRTPPIALTQNGNLFQPPADQNLPLDGTTNKQPDQIEAQQTDDCNCNLGMDDSDKSDVGSDEPAPEDQTNNTNTEGSCTTSNTPTPVNNTNNSAFSLEEPRSLSTFAAPMGNHIIVTPRMKSLDQNSQQLQPLEFNQPSMDHLEEGDEEAASSQEASSRCPMAMIGSPSVASNGRSHLSVRGRRRRARLQTKSESTTFTGEDVDETSSMPSWVRNEYIQQNQSPTSDNEHLFAIESSANEDTVCGLDSDREETLATITNYTQMQPVEETLALGTDQNEQPQESKPSYMEEPDVSDEPAGGGTALSTSPIEGPSSTIMRRNISMSQPDISSKRHQQDQVNPILLSCRRASAVAADDEAVVSQQNGCNLLDCYVYKLSSANHPSQSKIGCSYQSSYVNSIVSSGSVNPLIKTLDLSELNGERRELLAEMPMKASLDMDGEDEAHSLPNVARESMVLANGAHQMDNVSASMAEVSAVSGRENNSMTAGTLTLKHQVIVSNGNDRNHSMPSASSEMLNINIKTSQTNELGTFLSRSALLYNQEQQVLLLQRERQQQQHHMQSYQRNKTGSCSSINSLRRSFAKLFC